MMMILGYFCSLILCSTVTLTTAFLSPSSPTAHGIATRLNVVEDIQRPPTFLDDEDDGDVKITFMSEEEYEQEDEQEDIKPSGEGRKRWENLNPKIKQRLMEKGEAKAVANKKKREPSQDKKRRMLMHFKKLQQEKKLASKIERPLGFDERAPLSAFVPGMECTGVVISLTNYGAYVDVGTECDGLLHISQITREFFVEHPRQVLTAGDEVTVKVRSASPELKKMHLTMLELEVEEDREERIPLSEVEPDDELWGELKRVTDFGAYVEVGAEVDGFLHFMDHPLWEDGSQPSEFMQIGERVRVWVSDLDTEQRRIKLTANRPSHLPGPRREL